MAAHSYAQPSHSAKSKETPKRTGSARLDRPHQGLHLHRNLGNQGVYRAMQSGALGRLQRSGGGEMIARQGYRQPPPCTTVYCGLLSYNEECVRCCHETVPASDPQNCLGDCLFSCNSLPKKVKEVISDAALGAAVGVFLGGLLGFAVGGPVGAGAGALLAGILLGVGMPKPSGPPEA
jgi:hypothetical protein